MNQSKFERELSALNAQARKVLEAVPTGNIGGAWTESQIAAEMRRVGANPDPRVVKACLTDLTERGLVRRQGDTFVRVVPRTPITLAVPAEQAAPEAPAASPDTLSRLASLSAKLRGLGTALQEAANDIDTVALEVEDRIEEAGKGSAKLRQLQELLRSVV